MALWPFELQGVSADLAASCSTPGTPAPTLAAGWAPAGSARSPGPGNASSRRAWTALLAICGVSSRCPPGSAAPRDLARGEGRSTGPELSGGQENGPSDSTDNSLIAHRPPAGAPGHPRLHAGSSFPGRNQEPDDPSVQVFKDVLHRALSSEVEAAVRLSARPPQTWVFKPSLLLATNKWWYQQTSASGTGPSGRNRRCWLTVHHLRLVGCNRRQD
jgi:hypothetical protein